MEYDGTTFLSLSFDRDTENTISLIWNNYFLFFEKNTLTVLQDCVEFFLPSLPIIINPFDFDIQLIHKWQKWKATHLKTKSKQQEVSLPVVSPSATFSGLSISNSTLQPHQMAYGFQSVPCYLTSPCQWSAWNIFPSPSHFFPSLKLQNSHPKPLQSHLPYLVLLTCKT